ncbi:hypothetical protein [uncultured Microbacterium sp.]|uniref:hypothetical protein n=1 Tax=uncultured Microbacterium sp. TaxID=191216 RepID=UPI0025E89D87|nr:hypothetical protein [uncultured Microbacterium sp.]
MLPVAATAWGVALLTTFAPQLSTPLGAACALVALLLPVVRHGRRHRSGRTIVAVVPLLLLCAGVATGICVSAAIAQPARDQAARLAGHVVTAVVSVRSLPTTGADGRLWADADARRLGPGAVPSALPVPVRIGIPVDRRATKLGPGTVLRFTARSAPAGPGERSALVLFASGEVQHLSRGGPVETIAGDVRAAFLARARRLPEPGSELLPGLAVGEVRAVSDELDAAMKASGLSHLTAVSGRS